MIFLSIIQCNFAINSSSKMVDISMERKKNCFSSRSNNMINHYFTILYVVFQRFPSQYYFLDDNIYFSINNYSRLKIFSKKAGVKYEHFTPAFWPLWIHSTRTQIQKVILNSKTGFKRSFERFLVFKINQTQIWYDESINKY